MAVVRRESHLRLPSMVLLNVHLALGSFRLTAKSAMPQWIQSQSRCVLRCDQWARNGFKRSSLLLFKSFHQEAVLNHSDARTWPNRTLRLPNAVDSW
jgi:hypothetical protein